MYPDQSLYPADSVPNIVRRINNALRRADQIAHLEGEGDGNHWMAPIIADVEAGFGGALNAYELMKAMIEAGAAGVHFEDQLASEKKCGHLGGKVLVPIAQHIRTLNAARLAADVEGVATVLLCRTDAQSAQLLTSDIDERDRPFITGERTAEGFFRVRPEVGIEYAIARSLAYSLLLIGTCHRRGIHAMGGMAAQIPIRDDPAANEAAMAKFRADKDREAGDGHDGTWVAHPGLVPIAKVVFDRAMPEPNQIGRKRDDVRVTAADLLAVPKGGITEAGLRQNINIAIGYIEAWLRGTGCVPLHHLMEDAATAEISRAQVWQWLRHGARLEDGRAVDAALCRTILSDELAELRRPAGAPNRYQDAADLFAELMTAPAFPPFLTLPAYDRVTAEGV